jgi:hypothetical protein
VAINQSNDYAEDGFALGPAIDEPSFVSRSEREAAVVTAAQYVAQGGRGLDAAGRPLPLLTPQEIFAAMDAGLIPADHANEVLVGPGPTHLQRAEARRVAIWALRQQKASAARLGGSMTISDAWLHGNEAAGKPWGACDRCSAPFYLETLTYPVQSDPRRALCAACAASGSPNERSAARSVTKASGYQPPRAPRAPR